MYFFSKKDPDYKIKGSRDPLGLQLIWQNTGRELIPYLSTVSNTLMDFQILGMAYSIKDSYRVEEEDFDPFFLRFEQLMAYVRYHKDGSLGFNGISKVKVKITAANKQVYLGLGAAEQLLSNQKNYGIWGKYSSPFRAMGLDKNKELLDLYSRPLQQNGLYHKRITSILKKGRNETNSLHVDELSEWAMLIAPPLGREQEILCKALLKDNCNDELLRHFKASPELSDSGFYDLVGALKAESEHEEFIHKIEKIIATEQVISPLNRIFRYLQTQSYWKFSDLDGDPFIDKFKNKNPHSTYFSNEMQELASLLTRPNRELVKGLCERSSTIAQARNSSPWMTYTDNSLEVHHFEGEYFVGNYDYREDNDFSYFLPSYQRLYKELAPNGTSPL